MRLFQKLLADSISWEESNTIRSTVARILPRAIPVTELIEIALDTALLALETDTTILIDISHLPTSL